MMSQQDTKKPGTEERDKEVQKHELVAQTKPQIMSMTKSTERRKQSELTLGQLLSSGGPRNSILSAHKERRTANSVLTEHKSQDSEIRRPEIKKEVNLDQNPEKITSFKSEILDSQGNQPSQTCFQSQKPDVNNSENENDSRAKEDTRSRSEIEPTAAVEECKTPQTRLGAVLAGGRSRPVPNTGTMLQKQQSSLLSRGESEDMTYQSATRQAVKMSIFKQEILPCSPALTPDTKPEHGVGLRAQRHLQSEPSARLGQTNAQMNAPSMFIGGSAPFTSTTKQNILSQEPQQSQYSPGRVQRNLLSDNRSQNMFEKRPPTGENKPQGQQSIFGALRDAYYNLSYKAKGITHSHLTKTLQSEKDAIESKGKYLPIAYFLNRVYYLENHQKSKLPASQSESNPTHQTIKKLRKQNTMQPVSHLDSQKKEEQLQILKTASIMSVQSQTQTKLYSLDKVTDEIQERFHAITWFTYRRAIERPLQNSKATSDAGWGCMIRTGQMLLFQALQRHVLGDEFNYLAAHKYQRKADLNKYNILLSYFLDNLEQEDGCPFGIQNIAKVGLEFKRKPGDWYGPQAICNVLHQLNKSVKPVTDFRIVVCNDGNIFLNKIKKHIDKGNGVFVSVPVRLGLNDIQPEYLDCLKKVFHFESSCGIAGGMDFKALYFVGMINPEGQDPKLMYLDPHFVQDAIPAAKSKLWLDQLYTSDKSTGENCINQSLIQLQYHCKEVRTMSLNRICPSLAIGFYIRNLDEYFRFKAQIEEMRKMEDCIFSVFDQPADQSQIKVRKNLRKRNTLNAQELKQLDSKELKVPKQDKLKTQVSIQDNSSSKEIKNSLRDSGTASDSDGFEIL